MRIGFIGTGSMGGTLLRAWLSQGLLTTAQVIATNRTLRKVEEIALLYPELQIAHQNREVIEQSEVIFLCVKPSQFQQVIQDIQPVTTPSHIVVSITSGLLIEHLESQLPAKISKVIPSVTQCIAKGIALVMHGNRVMSEDRNRVEELFARISTPVQTDETLTRICSDITSCGPAFIAAFIEKFIEVAELKTKLPRIQATRLLTEMMLGTSYLLTTETMTLRELRDRVAVPGGITARGLQIIDQETTSLFEKIIDATHEKYAEDLEQANELFQHNV